MSEPWGLRTKTVLLGDVVFLIGYPSLIRLGKDDGVVLFGLG
jgi:hypothetical protein